MKTKLSRRLHRGRTNGLGYALSTAVKPLIKVHPLSLHRVRSNCCCFPVSFSLKQYIVVDGLF